jgi:hypothetical protein
LLAKYLTQTEQLLQLPQAPTTLYGTVALTSWINTARGQLAGESECIRALGLLTLAANTQSYPFTSISISTVGVQGVLNVRMATIPVTNGIARLDTWPWEYFNTYYIPQILAPTGTPTIWSQYSQGVNGTVFFSPIPASVSTVTFDTVCYPIDLVDDSTTEAIPFPWTDAICYYAAYLAFLSAQSANRQADALRMYELYKEFVKRARLMSTASVLPYQYEQSGDIVSPASATKPQQQAAGA